MAASVGSAMVMMGLVAGAAAVTDDSCQPGSGPKLAGHTLTSSSLSRYEPSGLRCADLTGANLSGLSLIQFDFTGADLTKANLRHSDLSQATLSNADLSGANLTDATMIQVTAQNTKMVGANLSGVDFTQADLTNADLSKADLSGTSFTQATLDHTTFTGATGLLPWNLFVLILAAVILVLLLIGPLRRSLGNASRGFGYSNQTGTNPTAMLARGVIGSIIVGVGFSLAIGGFLGEVLSAAGPPVSQTCVGALCKVGVSSGFIGIFGGVFVIIAGFAIRAARGRSRNVAPPQWSGGFTAGPYS